MYSEEFKDRVEQLSLNLVDLEGKDYQELASLLTHLDVIKEEVKSFKNNTLIKILEIICSFLEKLILRDIDPIEDPDAIIESVYLNFENFKKVIESSSKEINIPDDIQVHVDSIEVSSAQKEDLNIEQADDDLFADFINEAREYVVLLENHMLELEKYPSNLNLINEIFRPFHTLKGVSGFMGLKKINYLSHEAESVLDKARNGKLKITDKISALIFKAIDIVKKIISGLDVINRSENVSDQEIDNLVMHLRSALIQTDSNTSSDVEQEILPEISVVESSEEPQDSQTKSADDSIRVKVEKLDFLIDMVGELVITFNLIQLDKQVLGIVEHEFLKKISQLQRVISDLQKASMSLRMIPIGQTFAKMKRVVRDYKAKHHKDIDLIIIGEETEIDKNMVESLNEPLVHMIRNACDHGIESADVRKQKGKSEKGTITLNAYHKGNTMIIDVQDDGKGLDKEKILKKAIEKKLVEENQALTESEIFKLVFLPGFSTMETVSNVSGRGVGMDVVMQAINNLGGSVEIISTPDKGSVFRIILPLTLAIIEGMLVKVAEELYLIPIANIRRSLKPSKDMLNSVMEKGETVKVEGKLIPIIRLNRKFNIYKQDENLEKSLLIVLESGEKQFAIAVDELLGIRSVVVKTLGERFKDLEGISGATIMGDGRVGLILDVSKLDYQ